MFVKLSLSKEGQQSLQNRVLSQSTQSPNLKIKKTGQLNSESNNCQYDTNESTPKQMSEFTLNYDDKSEKMQAQRKVNFKISQMTDHHRHILAHSDGGLTCEDPKQIDKLRSVGKQMIKLIGRKILSGQFNLTKISIPIKSCYPKTALFNSVKGYSIFPYFMKSAAECKDPLERFKITLSCLIAQPYYLNMFLKPLNPILGQTLQASLSDGTKIYAEQISHHPPISYFLIIGPEESYRFSGYYDIQVNPGLNSLTIKNKGKRIFHFNDGSEIQTTYATNQFRSTFFGTSRIEQLDSFTVQDKKNNIKCSIEFDKVKKKPSDHFKSEIFINQKPVSQVQGTCLGYLNIDHKRYWDGRDLEEFSFNFQGAKSTLPSDWHNRQDLQALQSKDLQAGQKIKQKLQQLQRADAKLRKKYKINENASHN